MIVDKHYEEVETGIDKILGNFLKNFCSKIDKLALARYFKCSNFYNNKFISRSKLKYISTISECIKTITFDELIPLFTEYLLEKSYFKDVSESYVEAYVNYNKKENRSTKQGNKVIITNLENEVINHLMNYCGSHIGEFAFDNKNFKNKDYFIAFSVQKFLKEGSFERKLKSVYLVFDEIVSICQIYYLFRLSG